MTCRTNTPPNDASTMTRAEFIAKLHKQAGAVYLACHADVASDISESLSHAALLLTIAPSESAPTIAPYNCVSDMLRDALRYACIRDRLAIEDVDRAFEDCPMGSTNINPEESKATDEAIDKYMEGYRG